MKRKAFPYLFVLCYKNNLNANAAENHSAGRIVCRYYLHGNKIKALSSYFSPSSRLVGRKCQIALVNAFCLVRETI